MVDSAVREQPQGLWGLGPPRGRFPWGSSSWALPIPCFACSRRAGPACWACRLLGPVAESAHASHQDPQLWGGGRRVPVLAGVHRLRGGTCRCCRRSHVECCLQGPRSSPWQCGPAYGVPPSPSSPLFSSVQSLSRVRLFATPWTAADQACLSITNSQSSPKPTSTESVMPSSHLILCRPLLLLPSIFPSINSVWPMPLA